MTTIPLDSPSTSDRVAVVVVGVADDLRRRVCDALVASGAVVEVVDPGPPGLRTRHSGRSRSRHPESSPVSYRDGPSTYVVTIACDSGDERRSILGRWRHRRARETETARLLTAAANATDIPDSCRVLVVGETNQADQNRTESSWLSNLARDIAYEAVINGTPVYATAYIPVAAGISPPGSLCRVVDWCAGHDRP